MDNDIFDLFNDVLDSTGFSSIIHYQIYDAKMGMPVYCKHCGKNSWICSGDTQVQVFECRHPELSQEYGIPIDVLDSIPAYKVYTYDNSIDNGMEPI